MHIFSDLETRSLTRACLLCYARQTFQCSLRCEDSGLGGMISDPSFSYVLQFLNAQGFQCDMFLFCVLSASAALLNVALLPLIAHSFSSSQTMCASAAAGSMRIMLMPVDAWKTIKQVPSSLRTHETLIFHTWNHHSKFKLPFCRKHPSTRRVIKTADLTQVHGADGLKVLSAKAASISRCRFLPRYRDFRD